MKTSNTNKVQKLLDYAAFVERVKKSVESNLEIDEDGYIIWAEDDDDYTSDEQKQELVNAAFNYKLEK